jgi:hypothetical protein
MEGHLRSSSTSKAGKRPYGWPMLCWYDIKPNQKKKDKTKNISTNFIQNLAFHNLFFSGAIFKWNSFGLPD